MKHTTAIDTVKIQVDLNSQEQQQRLVNGVIEDLRSSQRKIHIKIEERRVGAILIGIEYCLYTKRNHIATLSTGMYEAGSYIKNTRAVVYYVAVKFAGLKSYDGAKDIASKSCLLSICSYFNIHRYSFKFKELDICLDVQCPYTGFMSKCTKKTPRTQYYTSKDTQAYKSTTYIEKIAKKKIHKATKRAYSYDKSHKEGLLYPLSRFEVKLQSKFFKNNNTDIKQIRKNLESYHILFIEQEQERLSFISIYENLKSTKRSEIDKLNIEQERITFDINIVEAFILELQSIDCL